MDSNDGQALAIASVIMNTVQVCFLAWIGMSQQSVRTRLESRQAQKRADDG